MNDHPYHPEEATPDPVPTWVKVIQAAVLGLVAGLALNALLSAVGVSGEGLPGPQNASPKQCKKASPARDAEAPQPTRPSIGSVRWSLEGQSAALAPYELPIGD